MSKWISGVLALVGILFSQVSAAFVVDLDTSATSPNFTIRVTEGADILFSLHSQFEGDGSMYSGEVHVLGAMDGFPDSIVVEQRIQYTYGDGPYLTGPDFTPVLFSDMNFFDSTKPGDCPICEDTYYDPITGAGYATENNSSQLDALYAVVALGEGVQRVDVGDYDDPGILVDRHTPRIFEDSGINVGVSFTDPDLMPGDIVSVTYRHLLAFGIESVPDCFIDVPEPPELLLFGLGLVLLRSVVRKQKGFAAPADKSA